MPINRVQFQQGMSLGEFMREYGSEAQCTAALERLRWPQGFRCPKCGTSRCCRVPRGGRMLLQCATCRHQASPTAGTLMDSSKLPLTTWFLAIYLISQAKTGVSALALMRQLGVSYRSAWLLHHKVMQAMAEADARQPLGGDILLDDAYLGGEKPGKPGRGSPNKVPFVAAVELTGDGRPKRVKMSALSGFTRQAVEQWAHRNLLPGSDVCSDGLACFDAVIDAGCAHSYVVVGQRKPRELPIFQWVNTVIGNLKAMIGGAHKHFLFRKYPHRYLGAFSYRFNHRFDLRGMVDTLLRHVMLANRCPEALLRTAELHA